MTESNMIETIQNKWQKVYWFSRMLINADKYVPIAKQPKLLITISSNIRLMLSQYTKNESINIHKQVLQNIIEERYKNSDTQRGRVKNLIYDLDKEIQTIDDLSVFLLTCENILIPLNQAIKNIPNDDREFTLHIAKSYLDVKGEDGLADIIMLWDDLGVKGCITAERTEIVRAFATLRVLLSNDKCFNDEDKDIILTAFTQEFERRSAQKRKKRAGGSLENVTDFILGYFSIKRSEKPEHFQTDIELDNWIKTKDNWLIGISCKRTLRERWKQVSSAESEILSKFKIKHIYHILTYDEDLSDEKITMLGSHRHIFYLPDNSRRLEIAKSHIGMKDYVRPISQLIKDLKNQL
ncbi:MAG: hypothetical protein PHR06_03350 [Candidatus Cloacimonetes bacterium]|nr:hypothetical protein [Candidatus Cloacimonadota bacterium]